MDDREDACFRPERVKEAQAIIERLTTRKRRPVEKSTWEARLDAVALSIRDNGAYIGVVALACVGLTFLSRSPVAAHMAIALSALLAALAVVATFIILIRALPFLRQRVNQPFAQTLALLGEALDLDLPEFVALLGCDRDMLEYLVTEYRHRRESLEGRGALLAGPLKKIGLLPAMAAFLALTIHVWPVINPGLHVLIFIVPIFYLIVFVDHDLLQEMDRCITVVECAIATLDRRQAQEQR